MKSIFSYFQRLQWKLTLSYAVVTIGTVIVLATLLVSIAILSENQEHNRIHNSIYWSKTAFQDNIPYLMNNPAILQAWLERVQAEGFTWDDFQSYIDDDSLVYANALLKKTYPIYVLDPDLNLVAAAPLDTPSALGKPFQARRSDDVSYESILEAALIGDKNYAAQSFTQPDGSYVAAFPLRKNDEDPFTAIVIYRFKPIAFATPSIPPIYTTFFLILTCVVFSIALPVGAIFGWLASRGLRKRLGKLSIAAKAWSQGDFSITPRDTSADEIGELTRGLNLMAEQLQTLLHTRHELARLEERNRLARDLHDTVKQQTYAARMQLSAAKNLLESDQKAAAEHIDAALQLNRETQQELKLLIDELRPAALESKGLAQAIQEYTARWQENTGIQVITSISGERSVPPAVEQVLYRVLQEALANVARHAEAKKVELMLSMTPHQLTLTISDNGRGFVPEAVSSNSLGLASMQQRLSEINGRLDIKSTLSVGTTVIAEVELAT